MVNLKILAVLTLGIMTITPTLADVTIVENDGSQVELGKKEVKFIPLSDNIIDEDNIRNSLFTKYGSSDEMLLYSETFTNEEKVILRKILIEEKIALMAENAKLKSVLEASAIIQDIESNLDSKEAVKNPDLILRSRLIDDKASKAENKALYTQESTITTINVDPFATDQITTNATTTQMSTLNFFDMVGNPYPIVKVVPKDNKFFEFTTINENIILVKPKLNHAEISGFVFLENVSQPIPVTFQSKTNKKVNVKLNVIIPSISPTAKQEKSESFDVSKLNNDINNTTFSFMNGKSVTGAKSLKITGLNRHTQAWKLGDYFYIRTLDDLKYGVLSVTRFGDWKLFKVYPRSLYRFISNGREIEVTIHE